MKWILAPAAAVAVSAGGSALAHHEPQLALDQAGVVEGIRTLCTGVGKTARERAQAMNYTLRIEVAGPGGHYLGDQIVRIAGQGLSDPLDVYCQGPWLLAALPRGRYSVTVGLSTHAGPTEAASVYVNGDGQTRLVLYFDDARYPTIAALSE